MDPVYSCQSQEDFLVISHSLYANQSCTLASEHCSSYTNQRWDYLCCLLWKQLLVWNVVSGWLIICYGWKWDPVKNFNECSPKQNFVTFVTEIRSW